MGRFETGPDLTATLKPLLSKWSIKIYGLVNCPLRKNCTIRTECFFLLPTKTLLLQVRGIAWKSLQVCVICYEYDSVLVKHGVQVE